MSEVLERYYYSDRHEAVTCTDHRKGEQGHLMVGLVFMIAVMLIMSTVAVQEFSARLRRENEAEMMFRAQDLVRGLIRYQQDRGTYPTELKQLDEPGSRNQRFVRRLYDDPLMPDGEWGLLFAAPGGGIIDPNRPLAGVADIIGERTSTPTQSQGGLQGGFADGAQAIGGLTIIGVKSLSTDQAFRVWNGLTDYADWQFTVYELQNQQQGSTVNTGGGRQGQGQNLAPGARTKGRPGGGAGPRGRGRGGNREGNRPGDN